jgi:hypothetical protein
VQTTVSISSAPTNRSTTLIAHLHLFGLLLWFVKDDLLSSLPCASIASDFSPPGKTHGKDSTMPFHNPTTLREDDYSNFPSTWYTIAVTAYAILSVYVLVLYVYDSMDRKVSMQPAELPGEHADSHAIIPTGSSRSILRLITGDEVQGMQEPLFENMGSRLRQESMVRQRSKVPGMCDAAAARGTDA